MHENSTGLLLSTSESNHGLDWGWGGATWPLTKSELGSVTACSAMASSSSGPYIWGFLLYSSMAALLSSARKWPRDGGLLALFTFSPSVLSLEHREKKHNLNLVVLLLVLLLFLSLQVWSVFLPLRDLLDSSRMLLIPIRFPSVMLLSWKKDPVDCNQLTRDSLGQ